MKLAELLDEVLLKEMIDAGFVSRKEHPALPLFIYNYTKKCQYDGMWNDVTRKCRGLIVDDTGEIACRPWEKFHNYSEHDTDEWDPNEICLVTDKMDGSLGILYPVDNGYAIATRGSFSSEQAISATEMWHAKYSHNLVLRGWTYLFEILYAANRVVVDYGDREELVLLGCVNNETGETMEAAMVGWPGPRVPRFGEMTLREALELEPRPNAEGIVLTFIDRDPEMRVKVKQEDYIALHRIITGLNERSVWEHLAVLACAPWIKEPNHWASFVGIDPERAAEILSVGSNWRESIPEEFQDWIDTTTARITKEVQSIIESALELEREATPLPTPREQYEHVEGHPCASEIMRVIKGQPYALIQQKAWRISKPDGVKAVFDREEDVA